jgi:trehalose synthase
MTALLESYAEVAGADVISHLQQLSESLQGMKVVHVNSTREGGGVAEILHKLVPLMGELGINTSWEVLTGDSDFYQCTKSFHNSLQGNAVHIPARLLRSFEMINQLNADRLWPTLAEADLVFIHDPQPVPLLAMCPDRRGKWVWRCHIDISKPYRPVWKYLSPFVHGYDASIFSMPDFARPLPHPSYLIPPSIDPLSEKNMELPADEVLRIYSSFGIDPKRPLVLQVSRYDRFKDPLGVVAAYRMAKKFIPSLQLVLAGGGASDDPEGEEVYREVMEAVEGDGDAHVLLLPPDAHRTINALQRAADIVVQKSIREGFGLTVTEAMWKGKPVIGGDTGGIRLQVIDHHTGFLVNTPEGAASRIRYLLRRPQKLEEMGRKAKGLVRDNFLLTRHLREYLTLIVGLLHGAADRIELG